IAFAFLGVPLAVASRGGRGSAYLVTLAVFVGFYALSRFGVALAENGLNAWIAGLLPNAVVFALGAAQTRQLVHAGVGKRPSGASCERCCSPAACPPGRSCRS